MGERMLSGYQYGVESTRGTSVAATRVLGADMKGIPLDRKWEGIKYNDGRRTQFNAKRNDGYLIEDSLTFSNGYFQALPMLFQCSLDGAITPTETTSSQADYKWDIDPSLTSTSAPKTITLEAFDDLQEYEAEYVMFNKIVLAGEVVQDGGSAPVSIEAGYFGRQWTESTKTASLALPTGLEMMNANLARLYKDTTYAGVAGTELTSTLRGFSLEILAGNHPKKFGDANRYFSSHGEGIIAVMLELTLEGNANANAIWDDYRAGTERAISFQIIGSQIGSGVNYLFRIDMFGYFAEAVMLDSESNGNNLTKTLFVAKEDTSHNYLTIDVIVNTNTA